VSQGKELDVLLALGAISEGDELKESADGKVCECPELASCSVPSHPATVAEPGTASPCSGVRSSFRIVRVVREVLSEADDVHPSSNSVRRESLDVVVIRLTSSMRQAVDCPYNVVREASFHQIAKFNAPERRFGALQAQATKSVLRCSLTPRNRRMTSSTLRSSR
jgi:hypothetical protein